MSIHIALLFLMNTTGSFKIYQVPSLVTMHYDSYLRWVIVFSRPCIKMQFLHHLHLPQIIKRINIMLISTVFLCSPRCTEIWVSEFVKQAGRFFFLYPWIISTLAYFSRPVARLVWRLVLVSWRLIISSEG